MTTKISILSVIREKQINRTMKYHLMPVIMDIIKKTYKMCESMENITLIYHKGM